LLLLRPTTFAAPRTTAANPTTFVSVSSAVPSTSIAPTITIPWIAFVPDISGVCSSVGTFEITSKPRKIASARIVSSTITVEVWFTPSPPPASRSCPP
jgi:hypothetical protein